MGTQMRHKSREGRLENKRQCLFKAGERTYAHIAKIKVQISSFIHPVNIQHLLYAQHNAQWAG